MSSVELQSAPSVDVGALEQWAVVFRPWQDEPVFHRLGDRRRTPCGRVIGVDLPWLPMKHARKFARPCRGCWPLR